MPTGQALPYRRERLGVGSRGRSPALAAVDGGWYTAGSRGLAPPPLFRTDPAREDDGDPGGFETPVAVVDTPPDVQRRPHMQPAAAASAQGVEVVLVKRSAKPVGLAGFFRRVREFVAHTRAPRLPDSLQDAGSVGPGPSRLRYLPNPPLLLPSRPPRQARRPKPPEKTTHRSSMSNSPTRSRPKCAKTSPLKRPKTRLRVRSGVRQPARSETRLDLDPSAPVVLFAGNLSYEAGADILLDAIVTVCCNGDHEALFLFAGEGAMRHDLQERASCAGLERRCRFLGDVPESDFDRVLKACDFVVIPGRAPQGEGLARMAVAGGKPVLTTHQAGTGGVVVHGRTD
jgi:glycosyltransferase involved in cell wall biosynthesis